MTDKARILFVDNDPVLTRVLCVALKKQPWEIVTADSGPKALAHMAQAPFDVIVSDECMPGMGGADLLRIVSELHPETIRIMLSSKADIDSIVKAVNSADVFRFLIKPCAADEVALTIRSALEKKGEYKQRWQQRQEQWSRESEELNSNFDHALDCIVMGFQPILDCSSGRIHAFEALLRSEDKDLNNPGAMFGAAEALGRCRELGRRIRKAIAIRIPDAPKQAQIFVNIEPDDLGDPELFALESPLTPFASRIVLEITERKSLISNENSEEVLQERLKKLRALGYRIAIDDLGAGYAGLNSFTLLEPEYVKLDLELVRDIDRLPTKIELVRSLIGLCKNLGIMCLAEGIETLEEREVLIALGCDLLQGFLFGEAKPNFELSKGFAA
ncbi:MAG: EAL domain-containing protein (putative c-di-GMP-specific phosphodiesterase class I) [Planctomycetota bacterium]|jgi:EAL domain-containing protein (putative c-di-GMP-specific phosphodiesterase class I)